MAPEESPGNQKSRPQFEITLASIYTSPILMMKNSLENTGFLLVHLMTIDALLLFLKKDQTWR